MTAAALLLNLGMLLLLPEMITVMKMPNGATLAAFLLSSAILPDASYPGSSSEWTGKT
jgi:membrane-bound ClpP family serine protease